MKNGLLLFIFSIGFLFLSNSLTAQNNAEISIQGTLKDANGASVADGDRQLVFKLYNVLSGGTSPWQETATVNVVGGIYSHNLGSINSPLPEAMFSSNVYLGITVGGAELSPRTAMTYAPYALSVASTQRISRGACSGQVGDIKYSILNEAQFAMENGDCWVPMKGQSITGTSLATEHGITMVPDMSGLFMRAAEFPSADDNDPDRSPTSPVGELQTGELGAHGHILESGGSHKHDYEDSYTSKFESYDNDSEVDPAVIPREGTSTQFRFTYGSDSAQITNTLSDEETDLEGGHTHTVNQTGGSETRPANRNFYAYIRVN